MYVCVVAIFLPRSNVINQNGFTSHSLLHSLSPSLHYISTPKHCNRSYSPTYVHTWIHEPIYHCTFTSSPASESQVSQAVTTTGAFCAIAVADLNLMIHNWSRFVWPTVHTALSLCVIKNEIKLKAWYIWRAFNQNFYGRD